jgi:hypothetical protein
MCRAAPSRVEVQPPGADDTAFDIESNFPPLNHDFNHFIVKRDALKAFPVAESSTPLRCQPRNAESWPGETGDQADPDRVADEVKRPS